MLEQRGIVAAAGGSLPRHNRNYAGSVPSLRSPFTIVSGFDFTRHAGSGAGRGVEPTRSPAPRVRLLPAAERARRASLLAIAGLCGLFQSLAGSAQPPAQPDPLVEPVVERVELNGQTYVVLPPWRGRRVENAANLADLVRAPAELTGELGIYVTHATRDALVAMAAAAQEQGVRLEVDSGYRSRGFQKRVLERRLAEGRPFRDAIRWTAPPGYSEHITGRALDFVPSDADFKDTAAYRWLREHAAAFCFTESYPLGNTGGFEWEPWHWRHDACDE